MPIPPNYKAQLDQLRAQAAIKAQLQQQYQAEMANKYTKDMIPFAQWLAQRSPGMAGGGEVENINPIKASAKSGSVEPEKTVKAYKLFRVHPDHPGKLFPLFVDANTPVEMGKWVDATEGAMSNGKVKSKIGPLAYRPGWHAGDLPIATHIGEKSDPSLTAPDRRPANHAWAEVEMPDDVDWQAEANKRGTNAQGKVVPVKAHITDQIPKGGHYRYKTNPNMTGNWLIGGSMKVNKVLTDAEVARINNAAGAADLPRAKPFNKKQFGFAHGGVVGPQEWMAEEHVNHQKPRAMPRLAAGGSPPSLDTMRLALNKQRMYSPLEKAAMAVPRNKGTPEEFMAEVSKQPGFRKDEVEDRKISFPKEKMSKEDFLAHLRSHMAPQLTAKVLSDESNQKFLDNLAKDLTGDDYSIYDDLYGNQQQDVLAMAARDPEYPPQPKYGDYQLPGGKNYREVLLKLPQRGLTDKERNTKMYIEANKRRGDISPEREAMLQRLTEKEKNQDYFSSHWNNEPNVLAHMRMSDRTGPNGEKVLHVEEIQSDWHQQGRKDGYASHLQEEAQELRNLQQKQYEGNLSRDEVNRMDDLQSRVKLNAVPDAPFKKNWHELALKHALVEAVKGGYHGIAITPGQEQANRYDLSKHLNEVNYGKNSDGTFSLTALDKNGRAALNESSLSESQLESMVGKDLAQKIVAGEGNDFPEGSVSEGKKSLTGLDLKIGGEGMKGFYDKIVPTYLNKLGKPHGAQVGQMPIDIYHDLLGYMPKDQMEIKTLNYFPITDSMRQQIKTEGLPQYMGGGIIHKAEGGNVQPTLAQMKLAIQGKINPINLKNVGIEEAPNMSPKLYLSPEQFKDSGGMPPPGGVATPSGMPIGGIDMEPHPGQQLMPQQMGQMALQGDQGQQGGLPQPQGLGAPQQAPQQPGSNILEMTPQGRALSALGSPQPGRPQAQGLADGGQPSVEQMKQELAGASAKAQPKRMLVKADGPGGVKGIMVPRHMWEGTSHAEGMKQINEARAQVYGSENRDPLSIGKIGAVHKQTLAEHFKKPIEQQRADEQAALERLRAAKHIGKTANTLDESEKLDTVRHETDSSGRTHVGYASKGTAGHALYTSGHGDNMKHHVINTCPGQTTGCGGGVDEKGIVDTKKGTCFAPNAESQYVNAAVRRAAHEQAKHDPAMTKDWILAHTGSLRQAAERADKKNQVTLFRPNVVDETDVSSRHVIRHLNDQRKQDGLPGIVANSYGKTNELHDPENGYHVTHSNVGPKVKKGREISENIGRDKARVRNTVMAADNRGDFTNEQGNKTPPKGSYMVTDVKRGSKLAKDMEGAITHAKYWTTGRSQDELTEDEKAEGPEAHYTGTGRKTTEDKAHYGHRTIGGERFDYQRQHILHPRLVQVGNNDDGTPHMIPTDSRFKDTEFLPKNRFKTKNGKDAGHILMTTPTESTSNLGHETPFTHNVNQSHVEHALKNKGEYVIDKPEDQINARGKEYAAPQPMIRMAEGGQVGGGRHPGYSDDDFHAFPERNIASQRHLAMRRGDDEEAPRRAKKAPVTMHNNIDTMRLALTKKAK